MAGPINENFGRLGEFQLLPTGSWSGVCAPIQSQERVIAAAKGLVCKVCKTPAPQEYKGLECDACGRRYTKRKKEFTAPASRSTYVYQESNYPIFYCFIPPVAPPIIKKSAAYQVARLDIPQPKHIDSINKMTAAIFEAPFCSNCETTVTPEWRSGPDGPRTLCNACGIQYRKRVRYSKQANLNEYRE